jgi:hypothetical protein
MSKSRLTQAVVLGALLAATNLASMTAIAVAQSEPTLTHDHQRPPTQGQVGEAWHQPPAAANQSAIAGHRQQKRLSLVLAQSARRHRRSAMRSAELSALHEPTRAA